MRVHSCVDSLELVARLPLDCEYNVFKLERNYSRQYDEIMALEVPRFLKRCQAVLRKSQGGNCCFVV